MRALIIENIPFNVQADHLVPLLKIKSGSKFAKRLTGLLETALKIARPKVAFKLSAVEREDAGEVLLDGVCFQSKVLQVNLKDCHRAFPFVATCGMELHDWMQTFREPLESFWADTVCMLALGASLETFKKQVNDMFKTGKTSTMNPGSLADWPLTEQPKLFSLLGDSCEAIGVRLTQSAMMVPLKSVSGIDFESGEKYYNCQLCPRDKCPGRRANYDEHLFEKRYKN